MKSLLLVVLLGCSMVAMNAQYCINGVGPTSVYDTDMGSVTINGAGGTTIRDYTGCPAPGTAVTGVRDLTSEGVQLAAGGTYTLNVNITSCGGNYAFTYGAWIDFQQEQTFTNDSPLGGSVTQSNVYGVKPITFTVPGNAKSGLTRMRVQVQENAASPYDLCRNFAYGSTKDFSVIIGGGSGGGGGGGGISGGDVFLIIFFVGGFVYVAAGCVYNRTQKGTTGMTESCPQNEFWFHTLPGLVKDGMSYTKMKVLGLCNKGGGSGHTAMTDDDL